MSQECSFRIGGPARYFCAPPSVPALRDCVLLARKLRLDYFILGGGSNLIFRDEGFDGIVISTQKLDSILIRPEGRVDVGAGLSNSALTAATIKNGLAGFEWASGLPGTIGGGVFMNAKCYTSAFSEIVHAVTALTPEGEQVHLKHSDCGFNYKCSIFQTNSYILTQVTLQLLPKNAETIRQRSDEVRQDREQKGQFLFPSAGCAFKNDYNIGVPAGRLIESCGLKGHQIGGVRVYAQHANFIINTGNGRTREVLELMALMTTRVWEKHHVRLEPEIRVVP
ncbi:UDP-N-acetylmuramate dehydrogenase [bacterium]|nr:UDP-N-acetylmuramate dehydrogenase [bacterium]